MELINLCNVLTYTLYYIDFGITLKTMHQVTTKLLLIFITIMAYLPMTVAYAVPDISMVEQVQSVSQMDMSNCHEQKVKQKCGHCAEQHNCNSSTGSCSTSFGIPSYSYDLTVNHKLNSWYAAYYVNTPRQHTSTLYRPPISL